MKISQYPQVPSLTVDDILVVVQGGLTRKATLAQLAAFIASGGGPVVDSVNGMIGDVVLTAADLGAVSAIDLTNAISTHDLDLDAHGGIANVVSDHIGQGGFTRHPVVTDTLEGFCPVLPGGASPTDVALRGDGSWGKPTNPRSIITTITSSGLVSEVPDVLLVDATGGSVAALLPAITAALHGKSYQIKRRDATSTPANTVTVAADAADDIDGAASISLVQFQAVTLVAKYDSGGNSFWSVF